LAVKLRPTEATVIKHVHFHYSSPLCLASYLHTHRSERFGKFRKEPLAAGFNVVLREFCAEAAVDPGFNFLDRRVDYALGVVKVPGGTAETTELRPERPAKSVIAAASRLDVGTTVFHRSGFGDWLNWLQVKSTALWFNATGAV